MRLVQISDTHLISTRAFDIPAGDVLLHSGDFTRRGRDEEIMEFDEWLAPLRDRFKHILVSLGNHEVGMEQRTYSDNYRQVERSPRRDKMALIKNATVLADEEIVIDGFKFYLSPWQPEFGNWAFNLPRGAKIKEKWDLIPKDTDILVTHGPPKYILDTTDFGDHAGCEMLLDAVKRIKPAVHQFGHIHEAYGLAQTEDTTFVNASICSVHYLADNRPIVLDLNRNADGKVVVEIVKGPETVKFQPSKEVDWSVE